MGNTINLLPVKSKDQIKKDTKRFKHDLFSVLIISGVVVIGILLMFVQALFQYNINSLESYINTANNTLNSYKTLADGLYVVDRKMTQIKLVKNNRVNPTDVVTYIESIAPASTTFSNFSLDSRNNFVLTMTNSNYLDVAKFLVTLGNQSLKISNVEIEEIDYNQGKNSFNFVINGSYSKNG